MARNLHYEIMKHGELQFLYAAFFNDRDDVFVKVGRSCKPYSRICQLAQQAPFEISRAVFTQCGSVPLANSVELRLQKQLTEHRTRGEWYRFKRTEGTFFAQVVRSVFANVVGRPLEWSSIDILKLRREILEKAAKGSPRYRGALSIAKRKDAA